jgi:hypothetical protein
MLEASPFRDSEESQGIRRQSLELVWSGNLQKLHDYMLCYLYA